METSQIEDVLRLRKVQAQKLATRLVWTFLAVNVVCIMIIAFLMEEVIHRRDEEEAGVVLALGWMLANLVSLGWTRKNARSSVEIQKIDRMLGGDPEGAPKVGKNPEAPPVPDSGFQSDARTGSANVVDTVLERDAVDPETRTALPAKTASPHFFLRALYFLFVGSWLGTAWGYFALLSCMLIVPLSLGQWMFRRLPLLLTLSKDQPPPPPAGKAPWSCPFFLRCLYFLFVGIWLGPVVFHVGLILCLLILPISPGQRVLRSLPQVMTLASSPRI